MSSRPVAAREVAAHLVEPAHGAPRGVADPMAGPEELDTADLVRRRLRATGQRRVVLGLRMPGPAGAAVAHGGLVPVPPFVTGTQTATEHLSRLAPGAG